MSKRVIELTHDILHLSSRVTTDWWQWGTASTHPRTLTLTNTHTHTTTICASSSSSSSSTQSLSFSLGATLVVTHERLFEYVVVCLVASSSSSQRACSRQHGFFFLFNRFRNIRLQFDFDEQVGFRFHKQLIDFGLLLMTKFDHHVSSQEFFKKVQTNVGITHQVLFAELCVIHTEFERSGWKRRGRCWKWHGNWLFKVRMCIVTNPLRVLHEMKRLGTTNEHGDQCVTPRRRSCC